jgi:DNA repair protein RecN (Recombination protein N)
MLVELDIRDFAIIDHLRLRLTPGFNVLTGETGAGKSIIVDAVSQLLGERADTADIRAGCQRALVEGVFEPGPAAARLQPAMAGYGIEPEAVLVLSREIAGGGRSLARVNGRAVPVKALSDIGQRLVDIHGQSENASLKREAEHIELLDRYAGLEEPRCELAEQVGHAVALARELAARQQDEALLARRAERLAFEVEEIGAAKPAVAEEEALLAERIRLANAERLAVLADGAYGALRGGGAHETGATDLLAMALKSLEALAQIDPALAPLHEALLAHSEQLSEAARRLLEYRDRLEFDPHRLEAVEERLAVMADLKRKYGPDIAAVIAHGEQAAAELEQISHSEEHIAELTTRHAAALAQIGELAADLSARRHEAAEQLARAVEAELAALGMPGSRFDVALERQPEAAGVPVGGERYAFDATGIDRVAFLVSTNPGEPPRPLVRVASGGETARLMLALKSILSAADDIPTLIFDEIDAGIGGRVGTVVGEKLWGLADRHQVLCVTHLPQVASYGDTHYHVRKRLADGRTATEVRHVDGEERVAELTAMLGTGTDAAGENALQLLQQSERWKRGQRGRSDFGS